VVCWLRLFFFFSGWVLYAKIDFAGDTYVSINSCMKIEDLLTASGCSHLWREKKKKKKKVMSICKISNCFYFLLMHDVLEKWRCTHVFLCRIIDYGVWICANPIIHYPSFLFAFSVPILHDFGILFGFEF